MSQERIKELEGVVLRLGNGIIEAVAEIDQTDNSRVGLQQTLDSVRETLEVAYGDGLTYDVNEHLGIENEEDDDDDEE